MPGSADAVKAYRVGLDAARTRLSSGLRRQFEGLSTDDLDDSFAEFIGRNEDVIAGGKQTAQTMTTTYLETLADARGVPFNPLPELEALATETPSGTIRASLDAIPSMVKAAIGEGRPVEEAMQYGGSLVERFVDDEMTRTADEEMKRQEQATELIVGWEGIVQPDSCDGCQDNEGEHDLDEEMYRHPGCDCERVPVFGEGAAVGEEVRTFDTAAEADAWAREQYGDSQFVKFEGQQPTSGVLAELPPDELQALRDYSTSGYSDLNSYLRGLGTENFTPEQLDERFIGPLDSALARQPLPETVVLSRTTEAAAFGGRNLDELAGQVLTEPGYMSTSVGPTAREGWPVHLNITAPEGTPAIYLEPVSAISGEREMLLGRGLTYRVDAIRHTGRTAEFFETEIIEMDVTILP